MNLNRVKLATDYIFQHLDTGKYPSVVGIESTNNCNLECVMCPRQEMTRKISDIDPVVFKKIIDDIKGKVEFVWLQDYGEPFLNKQIFELIKYARSQGVGTGISTNATVLTPKIIDGIFESGLDYIIFAIDGATRETYEKIRVGAKYDKVVENVRRFLEAKKKAGAQIFSVVQCIYMDATENEVAEFKRLWNIPGVDAVRIRQITYSGNHGKFSNTQKNKPCYWLWSNPHIKWDGTVVPCCQDVDAKHPLGNIQEMSLDKAWNSEKMQEMRRMHLEGKAGEIPLCRNCNMYQPSKPLIFGSSLFSYLTVNKLVPKVETLISKLRY
jgi:radical SAM protein with 4Fe4S-binding SPASM domain